MLHVLQNNIQKNDSELQHMITQHTCFYCSKNQSKTEFQHEVKLYAKLSSSLGVGILGLKRTTRYYEKSIMIPRCQTCYEEHNKHGKPALLWGTLTALLTFVVTFFTLKRLYIVIPTTLIVGFIGSLVYFGTVYRRRINLLGIKDANDIRNYQPVTELLDSGWSTIKP